MTTVPAAVEAISSAHASSASTVLFAQSARLADDLSAYQRSVAEELFDHLQQRDTLYSMVRIFAECTAALFEGWTQNPALPAQAAAHYVVDQTTLGARIGLRLCNMKVPAVIEPEPDDHRFNDPAWTDNLLFHVIQQNYLLAARYLLQVCDLPALEPTRRARLQYYTRQLVHALAPTNFPLTNPEVLRKTLATRGENIVQGLELLLEDHRQSSAVLRICMSAPGAFTLGRNIACTPGWVIAENALMQLIQYTPTTSSVYRTPLLIVPSWVNKYYILDLTPANSFIGWLVAQGHTVFVISWINPDASHSEADFAEYLQQGPLAALQTIEATTGEEQISAIGYCLGGVLLATTLAYCDGYGERRFRSATYLAASIDFSDPGDMGMFIDEDTVDAIERQMSEQGYLDGRLLAAGFNLLRENDLFWSYYVTNYLKGERPAAYDLMHWNTDNTNVTAANHSFVLRELHLHNRLIQPGGIILNGRRLDLHEVVTPTYILATEKDHIAKWRSTYTAAVLQSGDNRYVLAGSGHIAGVINPPDAEKYYFYVNERLPLMPEEWFAGAQQVPGSWWLDWQRWQQPYAGPQVPARQVDSSSALEPAPGRYVMSGRNAPATTLH